MSIETVSGFRGQGSRQVVELRGLEKALQAFDPKHVERAARMAINKSIRQGRTEASKSIRDKFKLPAARVNQEVKNIRMARAGSLTATIRAEGRPISLVAFGAKYVRNAYGRARTTTSKKSRISSRRARKTGVFVTIDKQSGRQHFPEAFMGRGKRGGGGLGYGEGALLVFHRKKDSKELVHKAAITIASMFDQDKVMDRTIKKINQVWDGEFDRQLNRLMK